MDLQPAFAPTSMVGRQVANLLCKEQLAFKLSQKAISLTKNGYHNSGLFDNWIFLCTGTGLRHRQSVDTREERSCLGTGGA